MRIHTATCASVSEYRSSQASLSDARSCCMWYRGSHRSRPGSVSAGEQTRVACCSCACLCCMFAPCVPLSLSPAAVINCCMMELFPFWNIMKWTDLTSIRCIRLYFFNWHFAFFSNQTAIRFDLVSAVQVVWCVMFSLGTSCKTLFKKKNFDIDRNIKRIWQFLNMNQKHRKLHIHSAN